MNERPLRVLIVDDEPLARRRIRGALRRHPDVEVLGDAADGEEAIERIRALSPDLVFLDIRMPGPDGLEVLSRLDPAHRPHVVFVTAHDDRALDAFRVHALDYLVKPFEDDRFDDMLDHVRMRLDTGREETETRLRALLDDALRHRNASGNTTPSHASRLRVTRGERTRFIDVGSVRYLEADGNHVVLHADEEHRIRTTLTGLLERLDPRRFVRIHRSTVLNLDHLKEIQPWFSGDYIAILVDGRQLRVSRHYRDGLLRLTH